MLKTRTKRATVSHKPTTVMYWEKPLPVSERASAPAAAPQKKRAAAKRDRLDELVETGKQFDNVIIE